MKRNTGLGCLLTIGAVILVLVLAFGIFALLEFLQRKLFLSGEDWIFFEPMPYAEVCMIIPVVALLMEGAMAVVYHLTGAGFTESANTFMAVLWKHKIPAVIISLVLIYVGFTGISSAGPDHVTKRSPLDPGGRTYDLELISSVDTGFKTRFRGKGEFYYIINVDGKKLKFGAPSVNYEKYPEYETETYKEFSDFDSKLMELGIPKNADVSSIEYAEYDESCMKYLRQVVQ